MGRYGDCEAEGLLRCLCACMGCCAWEVRVLNAGFVSFLYIVYNGVMYVSEQPCDSDEG
jgi:hypothetical protein